MFINTSSLQPCFAPPSTSHQPTSPSLHHMKRVHVSSVAPEILKARLADVVVWPCGDEGIDGIFRSNCRAPCCIVPPGGKTPDDEDSPKWERTLAQREADAEAERVLSFSPSECPTAERKFFGRRNLRLRCMARIRRRMRRSLRLSSPTQ